MTNGKAENLRSSIASPYEKGRRKLMKTEMNEQSANDPSVVSEPETIAPPLKSNVRTPPQSHVSPAKQKLTLYERWTLIIQVFGIILVVASLGFVAYQTRQTAELARRQAYEGGSGQMSAIDNIFVEHPELYPYFYDGKMIAKNDPEYFKVLTVAMAITNFLEGTLPRDGAEPMPWWEKYMNDQFAISPIMCEYLEQRQNWFDPRLVKIMRDARDRTNSPLVSEAVDRH
jgi:hypothetical protein